MRPQIAPCSSFSLCCAPRAALVLRPVSGRTRLLGGDPDSPPSEPPGRQGCWEGGGTHVCTCVYMHVCAAFHLVSGSRSTNVTSTRVHCTRDRRNEGEQLELPPAEEPQRVR